MGSKILLFFVGVLLLFLAYSSLPSLKRAIADARRNLRCSSKVQAEIISWNITEFSDDPDRYTPRIRYIWNDQIYETEVKQVDITAYQKKHDYPDDTMTIFVEPDDPTSLVPQTQKHETYTSAILKAILDSIGACFLSLFFLFFAVLIFWCIFR